MPNIDITIFPALSGESIIIRCSGDKYFTNLLIDAGFNVTFEEHIKKKLVALSSQKERLDACIITHIHSDHIGGIIPFLLQNRPDKCPEIIGINDVWFNGLQHIHTGIRVKDGLDQYERDILEGIISRGFDDYLPKAKAFEDIGAKEGNSLTSLILNNCHRWNYSFGGSAIVSDSLPTVKINDVEITIISPDLESLAVLDQYWLKELDKKKFDFKISQDDIVEKAFEYILAQEKTALISKLEDISIKEKSLKEIASEPFIEDISVVNRSSISFILRYKNKRILHLADSHPSVVMQSLMRYKKIYNDELNFDLIKVPHHGSGGNLDRKLLEMIDGKLFLFCTNGAKHCHPDAATIARIVSRPTSAQRKLLFNYPVDIARYFLRDDWRKEYNYEVIINESADTMEWRL